MFVHKFCAVQKKNGGKDSHLQFRMDIVDCLIERYGEVSGKKKAVLALQPSPMRLTERHLEVIAPSEKKLRPARKCYVCSLKKNDNRKELEKKHDTLARTVMLDCA
ncbi:piggyBac transposable element-derived protein 4 [Trichonephila clavipes]|nr:piggyBac transposable element-derived protein 4 [Trichonephila clavipes]